MEKLTFGKKLENVELSPEIKDLLDRFNFALPGPGYAFGRESQVGGKICEGIMKREYDVIIAEDASGRLPGLLMYDAMKQFYDSKKTKQDLGLFFITGSKNVDSKEEKKEKISEHIKNNISESHSSRKKVLVVTDVVMEGESLIPLVKSLKELKIKYDILTIGIGRTFHEHGRHVRILNEDLGSVTDARVGIPEIFDKRHLSGVVKNPNNVLSSRAPDNDMAKLGKVRDEIKVAAGRLYERIAGFRNEE